MKIPRYIIVLFAAFLLFIIPFSLSAKPKSCSSCHDMKPFYDSWQRSVHNKWDCRTCHQKPGIAGFLAFQGGFMYEVFAAVFDNNDIKNPGARAPNNDSCLGSNCHSLNREAGPDGTIKISHRLHVEKTDYRCIDCHRKVVHDNLEGAGRATPYRQLCKKCHASEIKNDCKYCHRRIDVQKYPDIQH